MTARVTVEQVLADLDEMNAAGRIAYADYSRLHDAISSLAEDRDAQEPVEVEWGVRLTSIFGVQVYRPQPSLEEAERHLEQVTAEFGWRLTASLAQRDVAPAAYGPWREVEGGTDRGE